MEQEDTPDSKSGSRRTQWLEFIFALALIGGGLFWLWQKQESAPAAASPPRGKARFALQGPMPVSTVTAQKGRIDITLDALGTVTPLATVTVRPQVAGQITDIKFSEGAEVQKGDILAVIDKRPYALAVEEARGQLAQSRAQLESAKRTLARYDTLLKQDSIARQQRDDQKALVAQYEGTVAANEARLGKAELDLSYCDVTAPVSGRTGLRAVDTGNYVTAGQESGVATITQLHPVSVLFSIPEDALQRVLKRLQSGAALPASAYDRGGAEKLAEGRLDTVDNQIDTATGTLRLRALFDNEDGRLFAGQFVNVRLLVDSDAGHIVLPASAVKTGAPGTYVFTVTDGKAHLAPVKTGVSSGDDISVTEGLKEGEQVVKEGADKLKEGAEVLLPAAQE